MIGLWMDEDMVEESEGMKKETAKKKTPTEPKCVCGHKGCCGQHKNGQCCCGKEGREHD